MFWIALAFLLLPSAAIANPIELTPLETLWFPFFPAAFFLYLLFFFATGRLRVTTKWDVMVWLGALAPGCLLATVRDGELPEPLFVELIHRPSDVLMNVWLLIILANLVISIVRSDRVVWKNRKDDLMWYGTWSFGGIVNLAILVPPWSREWEVLPGEGFFGYYDILRGGKFYLAHYLVLLPLLALYLWHRKSPQPWYLCFGGKGIRIERRGDASVEAEGDRSNLQRR